MDSGTNDLNSRERLRWGDASKVYTRRGKRKAVLISTAADNDEGATTAADNDEGATTAAATATPQAANSIYDSLKENSEIREPNLQTLDSEEPKLAGREREQTDARHLEKVISESRDYLSRNSSRDVGAGDEQAVASNGEEVHDDRSGPAVEPDGGVGCEPMAIDEPDVVQENHREEPEAIQENHIDEPVAIPENHIDEPDAIQENHIDEPDANPENQMDEPDAIPENHVDEPDAIPENHVDEPDAILENHLDEPDAIKENHIDEPDAIKENHIDEPDAIKENHIDKLDVVPENHVEENRIDELDAIQENHIEEPGALLENHIYKPGMIQQNHIDEPDGSTGCKPVVQENHIDEVDGSIGCKPMVQVNLIEKPDFVQDNHTDEPDGNVKNPPAVKDNIVKEPDGSTQCEPMVQDNHRDKLDGNLGCQDNHIVKPDENLECQPVVQDKHTDKPDGSTQCEPMEQDNHINELPSGNQTENEVVVKPIITRLEDRVRIDLSGARPADEVMDLRKKLESELYQVRDLAKKLEANELQLTSYDDNTGGTGAVSGNVVGAYAQPQFPRNYVIKNRTLVRVNSEVGSVGHQEGNRRLVRVHSEVGSVGHQEASMFRLPSIMVNESNHGVGEFVEKEKRTPKANQYYANSEFLLGKDRLPTESNKKLKPNGARKKHGGEMGYGFGFNFGSEKHKNQVFRRCIALLQKLMKHNYGWVFNKPVDAYSLGLHDYHDIIKHPMDLGTIKTRLSQNWYKSPMDFAEDVRLVFRNAMIYNPKGQDVHVMAEQMSKIFEERWALIEADYNPNWSLQVYHDSGLPTPTSRKAATPTFVPSPLSAPALAPQTRPFDRSESITRSADTKMKPSYPYRTPVPKKPKAKDPNKRDMTYEEKQKLSTNLQNLPSEKLDAIVQIIKKRNSALFQHDDEIEVDIDSVDAETLWELDRFVTNYKKSLSKNRKKAEIAQARAAQAALTTTPFPVVADSRKAIRSGEGNYPPTISQVPPAQCEKLVDNASRSSSSSSSSSSDSGSSSSDSDSDSSSAYGSDAGR